METKRRVFGGALLQGALFCAFSGILFHRRVIVLGVFEASFVDRVGLDRQTILLGTLERVLLPARAKINRSRPWASFRFIDYTLLQEGILVVEGGSVG